MVCEGSDLCKHLDIGFRSVFIGVAAAKLNFICGSVIKNIIFERKTSIRFGISKLENFDKKTYSQNDQIHSMFFIQN